MEFFRLKKIAMAAALAGMLFGITPLFAIPAAFTGSYTQSFDLALTNSETTMPSGFRMMTNAGGNATYTAASPISSVGIAAATSAGAQTLTVWNFGSAVASSSTSLFNVGSPDNPNDRALGSDSTGVAATVIELSLTNKIGSNLLGVTFSYDLKVLTNGSAGTEASELPGYSFFYSISGGTTAAEWTRVDALSLTNFTPGTTMNSGTVAITFPTPLTNNGLLYFRWADDNNTASSPDQMIAVDNVVVGIYASAVPILQQAKTVFVIAMENHNFKQPNPLTSPQQIFTNPAAPYINSLITPGHSNAVQVSYAMKYYNAGVGVHPSEANYVWAEGGTDFGIHTDNDPTAASANVFTNNHLTRQLSVAGIAWKSYQEDLQFAASPTNSASGTSGTTINPYYGTGQYNYAVKHNPMAFYTDTQKQNVFAFTNFLRDLTNNAIGRYNWITPNQYNDQHSALTGGFTYRGTSYTGDQAAIAQGDNFLSRLIPKIMASPAYQDHGVIILWWDESEGGDTTSYTIPEIIISPLAKGNAYGSSLELNHSSVIKTMAEIFGLAFLSNAIPAGETQASGSGHNDVAAVNDLSDLFQGVAGIGLLESGGTLTSAVSTVASGMVNVGACVTNTFAVTNCGLAPLVLTNVVTPGANASDFLVSGITLPASVAAGGMVTFQVVFSPGAGGTRSATLQITNNDALHNPFTIALTGFGVAAPTIVGGQTQLGSDGFHLTFVGPAGQTYQVLAADDLTVPLASWLVVSSGTFGSTNALFADGDATNHADRFYLIKSP